MNARRAAIALIAGVSVYGVMCDCAQAEDYPSRPITIIQGFAAGGPADFLARQLSQQMQEQFGQTVIVDSKTGAGGKVAAMYGSKSAPDGYTLFLGGVALTIAPALDNGPTVDPLADLTTITPLVATPNVLVVPVNSPIKDVPGLIAAAKASPGSITYGSSGVGTTLHLAGELFGKMAGVHLSHVPYRGATPAELDLIAGRLSLMFDSVVSATPLIKDGKLRALAVTGEKRSSLLPDVPTVAEAGLPGYEVTAWYGLFGPPKMAPAVVTRINAVVARSLQKPEIREKLMAIGMEPVPLPVDQSAKFVRSETQRWGELVRTSGAKAD